MKLLRSEVLKLRTARTVTWLAVTAVGSAQMSGDSAGRVMPVSQALLIWVRFAVLFTLGGMAATRRREIR